MASLNGTFDATGVAPAQPMDPLPAGKYRAHIIESELLPTRSGDYVAVAQARPSTGATVHYDDIVGSVEDARRYKDLCEVPVEIKKRSAP